MGAFSSLAPIVILASVVLLIATQMIDAQQQPSDDNVEQEYIKEWTTISQNGTRRVFNMGIGSLTSWAGRQFTNDNSMPDTPKLVTEMYPGSVKGVLREFNACWRYVAVGARKCFDDEACPPLLGIFFEVENEEDWISLRKRESFYDIIPAEPVQPLPEEIPLDAFHFVWGDLSPETSAKPTCEGSNWPPVISTTYWDFIIGGLLAWDGQLLDTKRYTWDLDAELESPNSIASSVAVAPSLSLEERRMLAVELVRSTSHSNFPFVNDRACPLTGNTIITPTEELAAEVFTAGPILADAIGTISPPFSQSFHDYVDNILIDGGWEFGANNSIHERLNPCADSGFINRSDWVRNPYYDDIVEWKAYRQSMQQDENNSTTTTSTSAAASPGNVLGLAAAATGGLALVLGANILFLW